MFASCDLSVPTLATSCATIRWFVVSTAACTDHAGGAPAGRHRAGMRIGEGDLLIGRGEHLLLNSLEALYLFFELGQLLLEPRGPGRKLLRRRLTGGGLAIGGVELAQIARNAPLDLRQAPFHLSLREVVVARVHRL